MHVSAIKFILITFLVLITSFAFSVPTFAYQNEPTGFRGINWGYKIKSVGDWQLKDGAEGLVFFNRKNDKMKIGDADLDNIDYIFYQNQLCGVKIEYSSLSNHEKLKNTYFQLYASRENPKFVNEEYSWTSKKVCIDLKFDTVTQKGEITYFYMPIAANALAAKKARDKKAAKKAAGDL